MEPADVERKLSEAGRTGEQRLGECQLRAGASGYVKAEVMWEGRWGNGWEAGAVAVGA